MTGVKKLIDNVLTWNSDIFYIMLGVLLSKQALLVIAPPNTGKSAIANTIHKIGRSVLNELTIKTRTLTRSGLFNDEIMRRANRNSLNIVLEETSKIFRIPYHTEEFGECISGLVYDKNLSSVQKGEVKNLTLNDASVIACVQSNWLKKLVVDRFDSWVSQYRQKMIRYYFLPVQSINRVEYDDFKKHFIPKIIDILKANLKDDEEHNYLDKIDLTELRKGLYYQCAERGLKYANRLTLSLSRLFTIKEVQEIVNFWGKRFQFEQKIMIVSTDPLETIIYDNEYNVLSYSLSGIDSMFQIACNIGVHESYISKILNNAQAIKYVFVDHNCNNGNCKRKIPHYHILPHQEIKRFLDVENGENSKE